MQWISHEGVSDSQAIWCSEVVLLSILIRIFFCLFVTDWIGHKGSVWCGKDLFCLYWTLNHWIFCAAPWELLMCQRVCWVPRRQGSDCPLPVMFSGLWLLVIEVLFNMFRILEHGIWCAHEMHPYILGEYIEILCRNKIVVSKGNKPLCQMFFLPNSSIPLSLPPPLHLTPSSIHPSIHPFILPPFLPPSIHPFLSTCSVPDPVWVPRDADNVHNLVESQKSK